MSARRKWKSAWGLALTLLGSGLGFSRESLAQTADPLSEAESAYERVEFDAVRTAVRRALERGHYERRQLVRLFFLQAVSAAAAGDEDAARTAATRVLLLDPEERASRALSPQLRAPFLEARGSLASHPERLRVLARYDREQQRVVVTLSDPLHLVRTLALRTRVGAGGYVAAQQPAAPSVALPRPAQPSEAVALVVRGLDEHDNVLVEQGTDEDPVLSAPVVGAAAGSPAGGAARANVPLLAAGGVSLGVGVVGMIVGGVLTNTYESNAAQWNNDGQCLPADGSTRESACGSLRMAAEGARPGAIAGFVVGGAFLGLGVALLAAGAPRGGAESAPQRAWRRIRCVPTPQLGVQCGGSF